MGLPANLLNQTITHYPKTGLSDEGRETFGAGTTHSVRFQRINKSRVSPTGQNIIIEAIVYLAGDAGISINDKITYESISYKVHSVYVAIDGPGNEHHTKLELVKWNL